MKINPYYEFVKNFFLSYNCSISDQGPYHMTIQLSADMDEELMNRPFYWHYMKKMNRQGEPMQLTFTHTNGSEIEGIYLHAGSPMLQRIYGIAMKKGQSARLYESIKEPVDQKAMNPWLILNALIQYRGKQARDEQLSVGINLIHGTILTNMMDSLWNISFDSQVSDYTFPMTPVISLISGYKRIHNYLDTYIQAADDSWAKDSILQLEKEQHLLQRFFETEDVSKDDFLKEQAQIETRYQPRVTISIVNGGLFYISQQTSQGLLMKTT
ncbi:YqhG family protein [Halobacillus rhizosphaerae]|uniref:YqhG family protein n=1 Tax=Halobacillus rhizosphaerae TaxID=3064889 RepID=UPI00398A6BC4